MRGREEERGGGGEVEKVVLMEEDGEEEDGEEKGDKVVLRWEKLLPRMPVTVLLVEGDDSTRQIIASLLRKCGYRVATASDGLKAWESVKEKSHSIDLVLTEVDLPSISGFNLLTMIMDHEAWKNIPVIMMSLHDSVTTVFKCMLKGAADFLVKPIRKNELRNLWQHVWRKQLASDGHGGINGHRVEYHIDRVKANVGKGILPSEYESLLQDNKECSELGSDAQSSCTRSDMEAESKDKQMLELKLPNFSNSTTLKDHKVVQNCAEHSQLDSAFFIPNSEGKDVDKISIRCLHDSKVTSETYSHGDNNDKTSKKAVDLLVTGDQRQSIHLHTVSSMVQNRLTNNAECLLLNELKNKSSSIPYLGLSLRRYEESCHKQQNDECSALNHSNSSAFSLYSSRTVLPTLLKPINLATQSKECIHDFNESLQDQGSISAPKCNSLVPAINLEDTKTMDVEAAVQDGSAVHCTPFRVIPFPVAVGGTPIDGLCSGYGPVVQPLFYQQQAHPLWNPVSLMWQEAASHANSLQHSEQENLKSFQDDFQYYQRAKSPSYHSARNQENNTQLLDEIGQDSTGVEESQSSSLHNNSRNCNGTTVNSSTSNFFKASREIGHEDVLLARQGTTPAEVHRLSQREAALNKFRLKRKERCFEKKVRYQSRKILAEQRPRVKGQFVRKVQFHSQSVPADCYPTDPAPG